jgi:hypothetical protein
MGAPITYLHGVHSRLICSSPLGRAPNARVAKPEPLPHQLRDATADCPGCHENGC